MQRNTFDVAIIGAGPAGLCAAINGASEGLSVVLLDSAMRLGGQARESACIENYPLPHGYPNGVTGEDLLQGFIEQAEKFCARIACPAQAVRLHQEKDCHIITTADFHEYKARTVILSPGLSYRRFVAVGVSRLMGRGIYYGIPSRASQFANKTVGVLGGANSAGQAAMRLARNQSTRVKLLARSPITNQMSTYLVNRMTAFNNVDVMEGCEVSKVGGKKRLEWCEVTRGRCTYQMQVDYLFIFIGAIPHTAWLQDRVLLDDKKYILTDSDLPDGTAEHVLPCQTSVPGIFAAGDVRHGQVVKRIAGATGDGVAAIQSIHRFLNGGGR